jgi:hypothetical protein
MLQRNNSARNWRDTSIDHRYLGLKQLQLQPADRRGLDLGVEAASQRGSVAVRMHTCFLLHLWTGQRGPNEDVDAWMA